MSNKVKLTLMRSPIGLESSQRRTCEALGLRKMRATRVHDDTPVIRGMVHKVRHLVAMEEVQEETSANS